MAQGYSLLGTDLRSALVMGLAGSKSPNSLVPECDSGNCTFPSTSEITYSSVGLSSECVDISSLITQSGQRPSSDSSYYAETNTTYSLPNGMNITYSSNLTKWSTILATSTKPILPGDIALTQRQKEISQNAIESTVFLMQTTNPCQNSSDYKESLGIRRIPMPLISTAACSQLNLPGVATLPGFFSLVAVSCFFYPSIQHYAGAVVNSNLVEKGVGDPVPLRWVSFAKGKVKDENTNRLWYYRFSNHCVIDNVVYNKNSPHNSSVPDGTITVDDWTGPKRCLYGLNNIWRHILEIRGPILSEYIFGKSLEGSPCSESGNYTSMVCGDAWWLTNLYNRGNATISTINTVLNAGFKSLTEQLRTHGTDWNNNTLVASGIVMENTVCTEFRAVWLVYPLVMLVGTLVLFIATLLSGSGLLGGGGVRETIWKSSVLPLLFYGLEARQQRDGPRLASVKELNEVAKTLKVDFSAKEGGWKFHAVDKGDVAEESQVRDGGRIIESRD